MATVAATVLVAIEAMEEAKALRAANTDLQRRLDEAVEEKDAALATAGPFYRSLYEVLERHGAEPEVLSIVGSLGDTLTIQECAAELQDWLSTGQSVRSVQ